MCWWDIPLAEETEIPKVPRQDHGDKLFDSQDVAHKEFMFVFLALQPTVFVL